LPLAAAVAAAAGVTAFASGITQTSVPAIVPTITTPDVTDGEVETIVKIGNKVIIGGNFTSAAPHGSSTTVPRPNIMAFDATTGAIDNSFVPAVDGEVMALEPGPTANTVYIAGAFSTVNGDTTHKKVALLNTTDGSLVGSFDVQGVTSSVTDLARFGTRLYLGGNFDSIAGVAHSGLATVNASTGALDPYMNIQLQGNHNWFPGSTGAQAEDGSAQRFDLSPDGTKLAVVGNFKTVDGTDHDQVVLINLTGPNAAIANWQTNRFDDACASQAFDSWVRDVSFSPDGSYFVVASSGAGFIGTLCDSANRWESNATGSLLQPTWIDYTGGDTLHSVAITGPAIYVGGHQRWQNNSLAGNAAMPGAVGRAGIAALDPLSGLPLKWNPGRNSRGNGARALYATTDGLYIGSDTDYIGNFQYTRKKIAFLPLAGGYVPATTGVQGLPGNIYTAKSNALPTTLYRVNVGGSLVNATDGGPNWSADTSGTSPYRATGGGAIVANFATTVTKTDSKLPAGTPLALFNSQRRDGLSPPDMQWNFPAPAGAHLKVRLYFAERQSPAPAIGSRVMDIRIDRTLVARSLDILAANGFDTATVREYDVTSDGNVDIDFTAIAGQPMLSAVEVISTGGASAIGLGRRSFNGTTAGTFTDAGGVGTDWFGIKGAWWIGGQLFYIQTVAGVTNVYKRSFNGTTFGDEVLVNPYSDPYWDTKLTGTGTTTYAGVKSNFYDEIPGLTSTWYENGKLYYTLSGQAALFWRWFTPDSATTGADKFTVAGSSGFDSIGGLMFTAAGKLYFSRTDGNLYRMDWVNGAPSGVATIINGPGTGGPDWHGSPSFLAP
jgi:hypothetical protein